MSAALCLKKYKARKLLTLSLLIAIVTGLSGCGVEVDPRTIVENRTGVKEFEKGSVTDSQKSFLEALKIDPFIGELHVNLGLTYQALQQGDAAIQSYESAEKWARNPSVLFASRFDQGVLRGQNKQIDPALDSYQRALEVKPDSLETKTNIELMMQKQAGEGKGDGKDDQNGKDGKDQKKDQDKNGQNKDDQKKDQDPKDQDKDKKDSDEKKEVQQSKQYKPREFKGDLSEQDVKKILGELKQQEQKIRGQFYRGDVKEKPRDKDW